MNIFTKKKRMLDFGLIMLALILIPQTQVFASTVAQSNPLSGLLGVILIFGLLASVFVIRTSWFRKLLNKNVFSRSKYKEGKQIVSEPITLRTSATVSDIMRELRTHVTLEELPLKWFKKCVYQVSSSNEGVFYAFGNKGWPRIFVAALVFSKSDGGATDCIFTITNWIESDGMISGHNDIKKLRQQVQSAFSAVGASAKTVKKSTKIHCGSCGVENLASAKFCKGCGKQM